MRFKLSGIALVAGEGEREGRRQGARQRNAQTRGENQYCQLRVSSFYSVIRRVHGNLRRERQYSPPALRPRARYGGAGRSGCSRGIINSSQTNLFVASAAFRYWVAVGSIRAAREGEARSTPWSAGPRRSRDSASAQVPRPPFSKFTNGRIHRRRGSAKQRGRVRGLGRRRFPRRRVARRFFPVIFSR